jgi:RNA polymerase sigma-70 factor (ECF subfamily)
LEAGEFGKTQEFPLADGDEEKGMSEQFGVPARSERPFLPPRAAQEDTDSLWEQLMAQRPALLRGAWRMLGNEADAEDAASESVLRAFEGYARYDAARPFAAWIRRIGRNVCLERLRARQDGASLEDARDVEAPPEGAPEAALERLERARWVREVVEGLPDGLREVARARIYEDRQHCEIAVLLGITEEAAQMRWSRARERLRGRLAAVGPAKHANGREHVSIQAWTRFAAEERGTGRE